MLGDLSDGSVLLSPSDPVFAATAGDDMHNSMRGKEAEGKYSREGGVGVSERKVAHAKKPSME